MPVPDYDDFMLPSLKLLSDQKEYSRRDIMAKLAAEFHLSDQDLSELVPSGLQTLFYNRVHWALFYLKKAVLIAAAPRSPYKITPRGMEVLAQNPAAINARFLRQFPEFVDFQRPVDPLPPIIRPPVDNGKETPEERLESAYQEISRAVATDLLDQVKDSTWQFFEKLVVRLLVAMGYGGSIPEAGKAIGRTGDGGIDGVIKQDSLGLDVIYIQAKKWDRSVGSPDVDSFVGALRVKHASKGVFITTSTFTQPAREHAAAISENVVLMDGSALAQWMIARDVGVTTESVYKVKKVDPDFFSEE